MTWGTDVEVSGRGEISEMNRLDRHPSHCTCSWCEDVGSHKRMRYGLNIPASKTWNAWWVVKIWPRTYVRCTVKWLPGNPERLTK